MFCTKILHIVVSPTDSVSLGGNGKLLAIAILDKPVSRKSENLDWEDTNHD